MLHGSRDPLPQSRSLIVPGLPDQINETQIFDYNDNFNPDLIENLPPWIQEQIKETPEWIKATGDQDLNQDHEIDKKNTNEDDCPF